MFPMNRRLFYLSALLPAWIAAAQTPLVTAAGNFSHIVKDLDKSVVFYRDVIGLEPGTKPTAFDPNPAIMKMGNTPGAQSRIATFKIPGSQIGVELIEYKDIDRKPVHPRFQDPGAACLDLLVKDLGTVLARVRKSEARFVTPGGKPAVVDANGRTEHVVFLTDPDGIFIELAQLDPALPSTAPEGSNILGGHLAITVNDTARSVKLYQALGFSGKSNEFDGNQQMMETVGVPGGQFKRTTGPIPGTQVSFSMFEIRGVDRKPLATRVQDPGTALLQLLVRDAGEAAKLAQQAGGAIISQGGEPTPLPGLGRIAIVRDPNNFFLEFIERQRSGGKQ